MSALMTSYDLHGLKLPNRVVMAPLTRARAGVTRIPNDLMAEYYTQRASAGLIISEATAISPQGYGWPNAPGVYTPEMVEGWKQVTKSVHDAGGHIFLQLWHMGRQSHSSFHNGELPVSASAIAVNDDGAHTLEGKKPREVPRALETHEIPGVVNDYKTAAQHAKDAGFDGVEIHGANGYLVDQFMQSKSNHRTDDYGGSIEKRARFLLEVTDAVTSVWESTRVGVRLSPNGVYGDMGSPDFHEQFTYAASELNKRNLAYLHVMDGLAFGFHKSGSPMTLEDFRKVFSGPLMANCGYTKEAGEKAIAEGHADLVAYGRPFISNPDLVARFQNNWPLAPVASMKLWYSSGAEGYTSFPTYTA
ncbi:alkene reductase [Lacunimicrobium album]